MIFLSSCEWNAMYEIKWLKQAMVCYRQIIDCKWPIQFFVRDGDFWEDDRTNELMNRRRAEICTWLLEKETGGLKSWDDSDLTIKYKVSANWQKEGKILSPAEAGSGHVILGQMHINESVKNAEGQELGKSPYVSLRWSPMGQENPNNPDGPSMRVWVDIMDGTKFDTKNKVVSSQWHDVSHLITCDFEKLYVTIYLTGQKNSRSVEVAVSNGSKSKTTGQIDISRMTEKIPCSCTSRFKFGAYVNHKNDDYWDEIRTEYHNLTYLFSDMAEDQSPLLTKNEQPDRRTLQ
ncbi:MAG: hypothetical protein AXW12_00450 [Thalassospira sp. Nap_22]|nr:MAG: hypothetical protein AXW12_00450 [Thalassospira sp. Nap_22]